MTLTSSDHKLFILALKIEVHLHENREALAVGNDNAYDILKALRNEVLNHIAYQTSGLNSIRACVVEDYVSILFFGSVIKW